MVTRRKYSPELMQEVLGLASQRGQAVTGVARDLGIRPNLIHRWRRELVERGHKALVGQGVAQDEELVRLHRELAQVRKKRDFSHGRFLQPGHNDHLPVKCALDVVWPATRWGTQRGGSLLIH